MTGLLIGLVIAGAYAALVVGIFRWARRRLLQRAEDAAAALRASGATVHAITPSPRWGQPASVDFELDGKRGRFEVRRYSRDWVLLSVNIACHPLPGIMIRAESAADRAGKALGLNREVQLGDAAFDEAAYLVSNASDDTVRAVLASAEIRRAVLEVLALGYRVDMSTEGLRATRLLLAMTPFDPAPVPSVMRGLEALAPLLPRLDPGTLVPPLRFGLSRLVVGSGIFSALAVTVFFTTLPGLRPPVDDTSSLAAIGLGLVAWLLLVVVIARLTRARSTGFLEVGLSALALFFGVPFVTAALLFLLNAGLDHGPMTTEKTHVLSLHRSKGDNDLRVEPWDPARTWQKVGVDYATFRTLHPGDAIEVDLHPGALGWPWVSAVRKAP